MIALEEFKEPGGRNDQPELETSIGDQISLAECVATREDRSRRQHERQQPPRHAADRWGCCLVYSLPASSNWAKKFRGVDSEELSDFASDYVHREPFEDAGKKRHASSRDGLRRPALHHASRRAESPAYPQSWNDSRI